MKLSSLFIASFALSATKQSSAKLSGAKLEVEAPEPNYANKNGPFFYPKDMPPPPEMLVEGFFSRLARDIQKYETPIQVWQANRIDQTNWNCIAHYHPTALSAITKQDPEPRVPEVYHTSEARALCMIFAVNKLIPDLVPISAETMSSWLDDLGLDSSIMSDEDAIELGVEGGDPSPRVIGSLVAAEVIKDMSIDGWNYQGTTNTKGEECTANCRPFADTYGYVPKNSPWKVTNPEAWQPLIESDDLGFFYAQEHVTPHIGFHAKPVILTKDDLNGIELADPKYNYSEEATKVIAQVASLDDYKKTLVSFFDKKLNIVAGILVRLRGKYFLSLEAQAFYLYGYTSSELDSVLLAWKEKVRHDRIRPTSIIQAMGDTEVKSFAGTHKAKDWVPYVRVMPHAEYPSGSGCICTGLAQFTNAFLSAEYSDESIETTWDFGDIIEPVTFKTMMELRDACGESRLWGGMHFSASVPDSYELCDGVGTKSYTDLMLPLLGDGTYAELMHKKKECHETPTAHQGTDLVTVGNNGATSKSGSLCHCEGDCNNDKDCAGNLICFTREKKEAVPGCTGDGEYGDDYCTVRPHAKYLMYRGNTAKAAKAGSAYPLGLCEGDCGNKDENCGEGLKCYKRNLFETVPGCDGRGARGKDYCIPK